MAGVPGNAVIVNVEVPSAIAAGISRRGMSAARKSACAIGAKTKKATNRLTPPYVTNAPASTTASIARRAPSRSVMKRAMASTEPLSSMSLPNSAPSRNSGKNCARNCAALPMNVCVQWASSGSRETAAAIKCGRRSQQEHAPSAISQPDKQSQCKRECLEGPWHQTCSRRTSRSSVECLPTLAPCSVRKDSAQRRPSSRSMLRKSHSALNLEEAPSLSMVLLEIR